MNNAARTMVCVDRFENGEVYGRVCHPLIGPLGEYAGVVELYTRMEDLFNRMSYPQPNFETRKFGGRASTGIQHNSGEVRQEMAEMKQEEIRPGDKATFIVQVQFRQNATWQGTVSWAEQKKTQRFRSVLELIKLMSDALETDPDTFAGWSQEPRQP